MSRLSIKGDCGLSGSARLERVAAKSLGTNLTN
jgi:hypothetical protein